MKRSTVSIVAAAISVLIAGCSTAPEDDAHEGIAHTNDELTSANVRRALEYGRGLVGTDYGWWYSGPLPAGAPMWTAAGPPPSASLVRSASANCAGLTNLMLRSVGKAIPSDPSAGRGGTGAYGRYYANVARPFDVNARYPAGTLIGRYFRDTYDQGHVAVVLENGHVLQSYADCRGCAAPGVNTSATLAESHAGYFYEYAVLPKDWLGSAAD